MRISNARLVEHMRASWLVSGKGTTALCSRVTVPGPRGTRLVRLGLRGVSLSGVVRCGSAWTCPVCAGIASAKRSARLRVALVEAKSRGYGARCGLLSASHVLGEPLSGLLDQWSDAWARIVRRSWVSDSESGICITRATEVTRSRLHGFHPHIHYVLVDRDGPEAATASCDRLVRAWCDTIGRSTTLEAQRHSPIRDPARYFSKGSLLEFSASSTTKDADAGSHSAMDLLHLAARGECVGWWREYERATYRRRAWAWVGSRMWADLGASVSAQPPAPARVYGGQLPMLHKPMFSIALDDAEHPVYDAGTAYRAALFAALVQSGLEYPDARMIAQHESERTNET